MSKLDREVIIERAIDNKINGLDGLRYNLGYKNSATVDVIIYQIKKMMEQNNTIVDVAKIELKNTRSHGIIDFAIDYVYA